MFGHHCISSLRDSNLNTNNSEQLNTITYPVAANLCAGHLIVHRVSCTHHAYVYALSNSGTRSIRHIVTSCIKINIFKSCSKVCQIERSKNYLDLSAKQQSPAEFFHKNTDEIGTS